jgi:hypothetical protein
LKKLRQRQIGLSDKKAHDGSHKLTFWKGIHRVWALGARLSRKAPWSALERLRARRLLSRTGRG